MLFYGAICVINNTKIIHFYRLQNFFIFGCWQLPEMFIDIR